MLRIAGLAVVVLLLQAQSAPTTQPSLKLQPIKVTDSREVSLTEEGEELGGSEEGMIQLSQGEPGLVVSLALSGPDVDRVTHYGFIELADGKYDTGQSLKLRSRTSHFGEDQVEGFINLRERRWGPEPERSKATVILRIPFKGPPRAARTVSARGTVKLRLAETLDVVIDDVLKKRGKIKNAVLDDLDLTLRITKPDGADAGADEADAASQPERAPAKAEEDEEGVGWPGPFGGRGGSITYVLQGDPSLMLDQQFVDADGKALSVMPQGTFSSGRTLRESFAFDRKPRGPVQLKLTLVKKRSTVELPFEFKDVPLP